MTTAIEWLRQEMKIRGWSQAELARRCNVTQATISHIINGERNIGKDVAISIARAFKIPPEEVFRHAGLLSPKPAADPLLDEINYMLSQLPHQVREEIAEYTRYRIERWEQQERKTKPTET